ncbi:hypothetical protein NX059_005408 [Plenodomus lindquistii]|nr:hypothetical protein NX059_005408 [Plenodomus lindquistii]
MNTASAAVAGPTNTLTDRAESMPPRSCTNREVQSSVWEHVLATKETRACELATVHATLFRASRSTATLSHSTRLAELVGDLDGSRAIIVKQLAVTQKEAQHAQRMIESLKTDVVVPEARQVQEKILLQLVECLEVAEPDMKIRDLLEKISTNIFTTNAPTKKTKDISISQESSTANVEVKSAIARAPKPSSIGIVAAQLRSERKAQAIEDPQKQEVAAVIKTNETPASHTRKQQETNAPPSNRNGKIRMKTVTVLRSLNAPKKTGIATSRVQKVPASQKATTSSRAKPTKKTEAAAVEVARRKGIPKKRQPLLNNEVSKAFGQEPPVGSGYTTKPTNLSDAGITKQPSLPSSKPHEPTPSTGLSNDSGAVIRPMQKKGTAKDGRKGLRQAGEPGVARKLSVREQRERQKQREEETKAKAVLKVSIEASALKIDNVKSFVDDEKSNKKVPKATYTPIATGGDQDRSVPNAMEGGDINNIV